jgi:copper chaperone CopZ
MATPGRRLRTLGLVLLLSACRDSEAVATFAVSGMFCQECPASVEETVRELPGVREVRITYPEGKMVVTYDPEEIDPQKIATAVDERGYGAKPVEGVP